MDKKIFCKNCVPSSFPLLPIGGWGKKVSGVVKNNIVCDKCRLTILKGSKAYAQTIGDENSKYKSWESDFLEIKDPVND